MSEQNSAKVFKVDYNDDPQFCEIIYSPDYLQKPLVIFLKETRTSVKTSLLLTYTLNDDKEAKHSANTSIFFFFMEMDCECKK